MSDDATLVLLVGVRPDLIARFRERLDLPWIDLQVATGAEEVRAVLAAREIDHVFLGGGLDLDARAEMVRAVFESSDRATVHMKDHRSGPEGFVPFFRAVLEGLRDYRSVESPNAVLRAQRAG